MLLKRTELLPVNVLHKLLINVMWLLDFMQWVISMLLVDALGCLDLGSDSAHVLQLLL